MRPRVAGWFWLLPTAPAVALRTQQCSGDVLVLSRVGRAWCGSRATSEQAPKGTVRAGATCPVALSISVFPSPGSPKGMCSQLWLLCDVETGGVFAAGLGVPLPNKGVQDLPNCLQYLTWPGHPQQCGAKCYPWPFWQCHTVFGLPQVALSCPCVTQMLCHPYRHCSSSFLEEFCVSCL